jgi:hypothetical protein
MFVFFIAAQIIFAVICSISGLIKVKQRQQALHYENAAGNTSVEDYQRFAASHRPLTNPADTPSYRLLPGCTLVMFIIVLYMIVPEILHFPATFQGFLNAFRQLNLFFLLALVVVLQALFIGYMLGRSVSSLVEALVVDAEAIRVFCLSRLQRREVSSLKLRAVLLNLLPELLLTEGVTFLYIFFLSRNPLAVQIPFVPTYLSFLLFAIFSIGILVVMIIYEAFRAPLQAYTSALQPIEQTQWVHLAPRIAAFAHLAGVEFSSIQVQQDLPDTFGIGLPGLYKPMLILSEFFLRHSEWRQQDALVCLAIGLTKKRVNRHQLLSHLIPFVISIAYFLLLLLGLVWFLRVGTSAVNTLFVFLFLSLIGVVVLLKVIRSYLRRHETWIYDEADRIASFLTGDPIALMVALNVLCSFNGQPLDSHSQRMSRLDELAHQPWPHAPQASLPVPAVCAIGFGSRYLSTSLDQATKPDPVPSTPYKDLVD